MNQSSGETLCILPVGSLSGTISPRLFVFTRSRKSLTTSSCTSACSKLARTSRSAGARFSSVKRA